MNPEYLSECFSYDPITGCLAWKERPRSHFRTERGWKTFLSQRAGKFAGCRSASAEGHVYLKVRADKKLHLCHRIIWLMTHRAIPEGLEVDHIDGDGTNNRLENLRLVSSSENKKNRSLTSRNKSGFHGVYWNDRLGLWIAQAWSDGKYLGSTSHANIEDAARSRVEMQQGHGFHENHGRPGRCQSPR